MELPLDVAQLAAGNAVMRRDREIRLRVLCEFYAAFDHQARLEELIQSISDVIPRYLPVDRVTVSLHDEASNSLVSGQLLRVLQRREQFVSAPQPVGYSISGRCFSECRPIVVEDCRTTDLIPREWVNHFGLKSVIAVPILARERPLGVLRLDHTIRYELFDAEDIAYYSLLGRQLGIVFDHARVLRERDEALQRLRDAEERNSLAAQAGSDGLWNWDLQQHQIQYSSRWKSTLGYGADELSAEPSEWLDRIHEDDRDRFESLLQAHLRHGTAEFICEHRLRHRDGSFRWMLARGHVLRDEDGIPTHIAGSQSDCTDRHLAEEASNAATIEDPLTHMASRVLFDDHLQRCINHQRRREGYHFAVLFLDADRFRVVNESLGHRCGDALLVAIAQRLHGCMRPGDTLGRFSGDEFVMLLEDVASLGEVEALAERIQRETRLPYSIAGHEVFSTLSIGIAYSASPQESADDVIRHADIAMHRAKALGKARHVLYEEGFRQELSPTLLLETELRRAVDRREFVLHFQPVFDLASELPVGFEALIRWQHPRRGIIPPAQFIPIAEDTGLIIPIGLQVIEGACRQLKDWGDLWLGPNPLFISVNLSAKQFDDASLTAEVRRILKEYDVPPAMLSFELTEGILMKHPERAATTLAELKRLGCRLYLDDFGTGYSSLAYLRRFPFDVLKIDRSFLVGMQTPGSNREIIRAIIQLAGSLGMGVVAEGIEEGLQSAELLEMGCAMGQSFSLQAPLRGTEVPGFIRARQG